MSEDSMLICLIAFVLGFLVARMTSGNGLIEGRELMYADDGSGRRVSCQAGSSMFTPCHEFYEQTSDATDAPRYKCIAHGWNNSCETGDRM
jgi:hypothetical protein